MYFISTSEENNWIMGWKEYKYFNGHGDETKTLEILKLKLIIISYIVPFVSLDLL